jgi:hypothetical protein
MRKRAYLLGREMVWSQVAVQYRESFNKARAARVSGYAATTAPLLERELEESLPPIKLDHLRAMTDSTGLIQHARFSLPHFPEGYCTDDNARALEFAVSLTNGQNHRGLYPTENQNSNLVGAYASFVNAAFNPELGKFRNFMSYDRRWLDEQGSDD